MVLHFLKKKHLEKFFEKKLYLVSLIILLSVVLRFWAIDSIGLSVPDSGNYVRMATWLIGQHGRPMYWEPPLYPISISLAFILFGKLDFVAIAVSAFYGVLMVVVVYLIGKELYDVKTGLLASLFMGVAAYSIVYSRYALAETAFAFFVASSFLLFIKAFRRKKLGLYIIFGIFAGFTFLTKYIGVLSLLIPLFYVFLYYVAGIRKGLPRKKIFSDFKGFVAAGFIMAAMQIPWIFAIGIGVYASSGGSSYFSLGDVDVGWVMTHASGIVNLGAKEYFMEFSRHSGIAATLVNTSNYFFYPMAIAMLVSPLIVAFFVIGCYLCFKKRREVNRFLLLWFFFFIFLFTLLVSYKASRFLLPAMPAFFIIASRGFLFFNFKKLSAILLILIVASSILLSLDTFTKYNDGYRKAGEFINKNVKGGELIFYTGMPQLLFYHEINTGNWWRYYDYNRTQDIRYVILESHAYEDRWRIFGFFDLERFESDFAPAAVIKNENSFSEIETYLTTGSAVPEHLKIIKIFRVDEDISGYFNTSWSG